MGIGIGIGHYTLSSGRFYADVLELSDFVFLRVRDRQSITALHRLNKKCDVKVSTDVAFLERLLPKTPKEQTHQKVAGFILRDWAYDDGYLASIEEVADNLLEQGYGVRFYSLDKLADRNYCKRFAEKYTLDVWDPWQVSVDEFLAKIEECTMIISSRAHGAILANYKSLPVVILEIEPKLTHIHLLLKESTFPVKIPIDKIALVSLIKEIASRAADLSAIAKSEYNSNQQQVLEAFDELREFMELRMKA